jgi:hypothetical protein
MEGQLAKKEFESEVKTGAVVGALRKKCSFNNK